MWIFIIGLGLGCVGKSIDQDGDGFFVEQDCDDNNAQINPLASEVCNDVDDDCDGDVDNEPVDGLTYFPDLDADGYGVVTGAKIFCSIEEGFSERSDDCDDGLSSVHPNADEMCNSIDDDCDGATDEDPIDGPLFYADNDRDGYGDASQAARFCEIVDGFSSSPTDCNDNSAATYPGAAENEPQLCTLDLDSDGYGDANALSPVDSGTDCDDQNSEINPAAIELCNSIDDDCDPATTEENIVSLIDSLGNFIDVSAEFNSGTPDSPYQYTLNTDATLNVCTGTYSVLMDSNSDLTVQGVGAPIFTVDHEQVSNAYAVENNGDAVTTHLNNLVFDGYALAFKGDPNTMSSLVFDNVLVMNGWSYIGGAINIANFDAVISNSFFEDCSGGFVGSALTAFSSYVTVENTVISMPNEDTYTGIFANQCDVELTDTLITDMIGYAAVLSNSDLICEGSSAASTAGAHSNSAGIFIDDSTLTASYCDLGNSNTALDNEIDITTSTGNEYLAGDDATFYCSATQCGSQSNETYYASQSQDLSAVERGNVFTVQQDLTIDDFGLYLDGVGCGSLNELNSTGNGSVSAQSSGTLVSAHACYCGLVYGVYKEESGSWNVQWTSSRNFFVDGYASSGQIGLAFRAGDVLALTTDVSCQSEFTYYFDPLPGPSSSVLSLDYGIGGNADGAINGTFSIKPNYYDQEVNFSTVP